MTDCSDDVAGCCVSGIVSGAVSGAVSGIVAGIVGRSLYGRMMDLPSMHPERRNADTAPDSSSLRLRLKEIDEVYIFFFCYNIGLTCCRSGDSFLILFHPALLSVVADRILSGIREKGRAVLADS
ncbi:MAG: hypothetical protein D3914_01290 [Candidatus Electrothrix sp. LOE2]|nr:hypothetical protein [Candidatus Electrothrix sp. LOE2]